MAEDRYTLEKLQKDMEILKAENAIQTIAVIALFLFGISTINDLTKKA